MKRKNRNSIWAQVIFIMVLGLVIPYVFGDFRPGELIGDMDTIEIEALFGALSTILAVLALLLGAGYLVYRAARGDEEAIWSEWKDEDDL